MVIKKSKIDSYLRLQKTDNISFKRYNNFDSRTIPCITFHIYTNTYMFTVVLFIIIFFFKKTMFISGLTNNSMCCIYFLQISKICTCYLTEYNSFETNELELYIIYLFYIIEPNIILDFRYIVVASPYHPPPKKFHLPLVLLSVGAQLVSQSVSQPVNQMTQSRITAEMCRESILKAFQAREQKIQKSVSWPGLSTVSKKEDRREGDQRVSSESYSGLTCPRWTLSSKPMRHRDQRGDKISFRCEYF